MHAQLASHHVYAQHQHHHITNHAKTPLAAPSPSEKPFFCFILSSHGEEKRVAKAPKAHWSMQINIVYPSDPFQSIKGYMASCHFERITQKIHRLTGVCNGCMIKRTITILIWNSSLETSINQLSSGFKIIRHGIQPPSHFQMISWRRNLGWK